MSLVITGNDRKTRDIYDRNDNQQGYSYTNYLTQPLQLPRDCEVAVQSVKCDKNSALVIKTTDLLYLYYNKRASTLGVTGTQNSNGWEIPVSPDLNGDDMRVVSHTEYTNIWTKAINLALSFPDFQGQTREQLTNLQVTTDATGFAGYNLKFEYLPTVSTNLFANNYESGNTNTTAVDLIPATNGVKLTSKATAVLGDADNWIKAHEYPISRNESEVVFDLTQLWTGDDAFDCEFMVGLSRFTNQKEDTPIGLNYGMSFFSPNDVYFEYVVACEKINNDYFLKVGHFTKGTGAGRDMFNMTDIQYAKKLQDGTDTAFTGSSWDTVYDMGNNDNAFKYIRFKVLNEVVSISMGYDSGGSIAYDFLTGQQLKATQSAPKKSYPKPNGQTSWLLYPKIWFGSPSKEIHMISYKGIDTGFKAGDNDWTEKQRLNGNYDSVMILDEKPWNDMEDATEYTYSTASMGFIDSSYEVQVVLVGGLDIYSHSVGANMSDDLGFYGREYLDASNGVISSRKITYTSDTTPDKNESLSLFVRLDNLGNKTFNAHTHQPSKIIYHFPKFDTNGRTNGYGLYYEANQRNYVRLNNSEPMNVNELALSLCNVDEQLATDITGQTIICLDFRKHDCNCDNK